MSARGRAIPRGNIQEPCSFTKVEVAVDPEPPRACRWERRHLAGSGYSIGAGWKPAWPNEREWFTLRPAGAGGHTARSAERTGVGRPSPSLATCRQTVTLSTSLSAVCQQPGREKNPKDLGASLRQLEHPFGVLGGVVAVAQKDPRGSRRFGRHRVSRSRSKGPGDCVMTLPPAGSGCRQDAGGPSEWVVGFGGWWLEEPLLVVVALGSEVAGPPSTNPLPSFGTGGLGIAVGPKRRRRREADSFPTARPKRHAESPWSRSPLLPSQRRRVAGSAGILPALATRSMRRLTPTADPSTPTPTTARSRTRTCR